MAECNNLIHSLSIYHIDKFNFNTKVKYSKKKKNLLVESQPNIIDKKNIQNYDICFPVNKLCSTGIYTLFFKAHNFFKTNSDNNFRVNTNIKTAESITITKKIKKNVQVFRLCCKFYFDNLNDDKYIKLGLCYRDGITKEKYILYDLFFGKGNINYKSYIKYLKKNFIKNDKYHSNYQIIDKDEQTRKNEILINSSEEVFINELDEDILIECRGEDLLIELDKSDLDIFSDYIQDNKDELIVSRNIEEIIIDFNNELESSNNCKVEKKLPVDNYKKEILQQKRKHKQIKILEKLQQKVLSRFKKSVQDDKIKQENKLKREILEKLQKNVLFKVKKSVKDEKIKQKNKFKIEILEKIQKNVLFGVKKSVQDDNIKQKIENKDLEENYEESQQEDKNYDYKLQEIEELIKDKDLLNKEKDELFNKEDNDLLEDDYEELDILLDFDNKESFKKNIFYDTEVKKKKNLKIYPNENIPQKLFEELNKNFECQINENDKNQDQDNIFIFFNLDLDQNIYEYIKKIKNLLKTYERKYLYLPNINTCVKLLSIYNFNYEELKSNFLNKFSLVFSLFIDKYYQKKNKILWLPLISRNKYGYINYIDFNRKKFISNHPDIKCRSGKNFINQFSKKYYIDIVKNIRYDVKKRIDILSRYKFIIIFDDIKFSGFINDYLLEVISSGAIPIYSGPRNNFFYKFPGIIRLENFTDMDTLIIFLKNINYNLYKNLVFKNFYLLRRYFLITSEKNIFSFIGKNIENDI